MNRTKNEKPLTELKAKKQKRPLMTRMPATGEQSEEFFFRFVDKNPLFRNNTKGAIKEFILNLHKRKSTFNAHDDDDYEKTEDYYISYRVHQRDK